MSPYFSPHYVHHIISEILTTSKSGNFNLTFWNLHHYESGIFHPKPVSDPVNEFDDSQILDYSLRIRSFDSLFTITEFFPV
jgi:hypothetical protein